MTMDNNHTDLSAEGSKQALAERELISHLIETGHHKTNFTRQTVFFKTLFQHNVLRQSIPDNFSSVHPIHGKGDAMIGHNARRGGGQILRYLHSSQMLWCLVQRGWTRKIIFVIDVPLQEPGKSFADGTKHKAVHDFDRPLLGVSWWVYEDPKRDRVEEIMWKF